MQSARTRHSRVFATLVSAALLASVVVLGVVPGATPPAAAAVPVAPNPLIADSCGLDVTLVLDASGSIQSSNAVEDVRGAADAFLDALRNTQSTARVTQFATVTEELAPPTIVDDAALQAGGELRTALNDYYSPKPPRPSGVTFREYDGSGNPLSSSNYRENNNSNQYTNWDQSLQQAGDTPAELVVYVTDGDPTAFDFDHAGDPFDPGPPPDVAVRTDQSSEAREVTLDRAIEEANVIKNASTRMLAVGVGSAVNNSQSQDRLKQISGPQLVTSLAGVDSLNEVDVAAVRDFDDLAQFLREVVLELCSPSLTIRKLAQSPGSIEYEPVADWDMSVTPTVPGGFGWILPDTAAATSKTVATDADGFAQFQWEPTVAGSLSSALVSEALKPNYIAGRPGAGNDWACELKDVDGNLRTVAGELDLTVPTAPSWNLAPPTLTPAIGEEIVTCTVYNSYDYDPALTLTKVDDPTVVRSDVFGPPDYPANIGDLVTSTFTVQNTGNAVLQLVQGGDTRCSNITLVSGDTNGDLLLDPAYPNLTPPLPAEAFVFECTRTGRWEGTSIENVVNVVGVDPTGQILTDTDSAVVQIRTPGIAIVKTADPLEVESGAATPVTYTYVVTNPGDVPLDEVSVTDAEPEPQGSCSPVELQSGDTNGDASLDPSETWTYTCETTVTIAEPLVNTATVEGTPVITGRPGAYPNPPVTATDDAVVTPVVPGLELTKNAIPEVVYPGTDVEYTYTVTNSGEVNLYNPADLDANGPTRDGWIVDDLGPTGTCAPVFYVEGDDEDYILNPGETWTYTCTTAIDNPARNTASVVAQTEGGTSLSDFADDFVDVVEPAIDLEKSSVRSMVLDPAALESQGGQALFGPDVPLPFPAVYQYLVTNPGALPLTDVQVSDTYGGLDKSCPVEPVLQAPGVNAGDANADGALDVDESWQFQCVLGLVPGPDPENFLTKADSDLGDAQSETEPAPVTNTAVATGVPDDGDQEIPGLPALVTSPERDQLVEVIEPRIAITKDVSSPVVLPGTEVLYRMQVTNPGDVPMRVIGVRDDKCVVLPEPGFPNRGDVNTDGLLDLTETWFYRCTDVIETPTSGTLVTNVAEVYARDPLGNTYSDDDPAEVRVIDPAINLVKTVSDTLVPSGTEVDYDFAVTNIGTSPLAGDDVLAEVTLVDAAEPEQPTCASPALVAKEGGNQDDLLDREPAETWRYTCSATITAATTNVGEVNAVGGLQYQLEVPVSDVDTAFVQAFNPGIEVVKSANPTVVFDSGQVTYTYNVRNTGDVPLSGVADRIQDDTCSPVSYVSGDIDGDGLLDTPNSIFEDSLDETWVFTCVTTVSQTTTNTVAVTGTPTNPDGEPLCHPPIAPGGVQQLALPANCDVSDRDVETVTAVRPASITIVKQATPPTSEVFPFTFGSESFGLTHAGSKTFAGLRPGTYEVRESGLEGWELVSISCADPTGDSSTALGTGLSTVTVSEGESVTCTYVNQQDATEEVVPPPDPGDPGAGEGLPATGADLRLILATTTLGLLLLLVGIGTARLAATRS